jgi:hypothetical protein
MVQMLKSRIVLVLIAFFSLVGSATVMTSPQHTYAQKPAARLAATEPCPETDSDEDIAVATMEPTAEPTMEATAEPTSEQVDNPCGETGTANDADDEQVSNNHEHVGQSDEGQVGNTSAPDPSNGNKEDQGQQGDQGN